MRMPRRRSGRIGEGSMALLTAGDTAMLDGEAGEAATFAMQILAAFARAVGAPALLDITRAHIDGCLYHGQVSLDFVERMVAGGGRVRVPTSLNVGAIDLIHPELIRLSGAEKAPGIRLMKAHEELGCAPSFTCAPYQTQFRPAFGEQIAWGESNAIVFANSVIGARTNRYGDFIDLCCAITGRAPAWGLHLDEPRLGRVLFRLDGFPPSRHPADALFVAVGLLVGSLAGDRVPVIDGLPPPRSEDQLKALGRRRGLLRRRRAVPRGGDHAGSADVGRRAGRQAAGTDDRDPARGRDARLAPAVDGSRRIADHSRLPRHAALLPRRMGTPAAAVARSGALATYSHLREHRRSTLQELRDEGLLDGTDAFRLIVVTDTCTYITPIVENMAGTVMTNSGKWAHYAPGNLGVQVAFGELEDCVASAAAGRVVRTTA